MNLTKKITLALGVVAATAASYAQQPAATSTTPIGILGQQYTEVSFGAQDIKHLSPNAYSFDLAGNVPVNANVDVSGDYSYGWIRGGINAHSNTLSTAATLHTTYAGVKPFAVAALGYQWEHDVGVNHSFAIWGAQIGVEIPVGDITLTPTVAYADDFRASRKSSQAIVTNVEANYWFTKTTAGFAGIGYTDTQRSGADSWNYSAGVRVRF